MPSDPKEVPTFATRLTSSVPAAIAVIEVVGPRATELVERHWKPAHEPMHLEQDRIRYGCFRHDPYSDVSPSESIVVVRRSGNCIELHCHGGIKASEFLLSALERSGATLGTPFEAIQRTCRDAIEAEAAEDLLHAKTVRTAAVLMDQWRGALGQSIHQIQNMVAEDHFEAAKLACEALIERAALGRHLIRPWRVVLCGPPNVGKSRLLNRLLGYTRAIVHEQAGTTRDLLIETTSIDGWPITLIDSAGVRSSQDDIESQGIDKARTAIESADLLLLLVDPHQGWTSEHATIWRSHRLRCLVVQTMCDLTETGSPTWPSDAEPVPVSASTGEGIPVLLERISSILVPVPPKPGEAVPFRDRHMEILHALRDRSSYCGGRLC